MKILFRRNYFSIGILIIILCISACKEEKFDEITSLDLERIFSPTQLRYNITNHKNVQVSWQPVSGASTYTIEVSKDSLKFEDIIFSNQELTSSSVTLALEYLTLYSVRVKANSLDSEKEDSRYNFFTFSTEGALLPINSEELNSRNVVVRWDAGIEVTHLSFIAADQTEIKFDISTQEKEDGEKLCVGLTPLTSYKVLLYNAEKLLGIISLSTPDNGLTPADDWIGAINNANAGDIITLAADTFIATERFTITKPITIIGYSAAKRTVIKIHTVGAGTCYTLTLSEAGDIKFENIHFSGYLADSATRQQYLITPTNNLIQNLYITNCKVDHIDRGFVRTSSSVSDATLKVIVDNCQFYDVTNTGADFIDFRNYSVNSVTLKNSTLDFSARSRAIVRVDGFISNITIDHCTFYNVGGNVSNPFIRNIDGSTVIISNNIIANAPLMSYFLTTILSITTDIKYNNYLASDVLRDYATQTNKLEISPAFVDPSIGDFTLPTGSLLRTSDEQGKALGDPRWAK